MNAQDEKQFSGSVLWKISGKNLKEPSYVLGTHHLIDTTFLETVKGYEEAFNRSNVIIGEIDMENKEQMMLEVQGALLIGEGEKGYKEVLSDEEFKKLNSDLLQHLGVPLTPFLQAKPALLSTLLAAKLHQMVEPSFNPQTFVPIDEHIQKKARTNGKAVAGLETVQDQIEALFSDPFEQQLKELLCALNEMDLGEITYKKLNQYYKSGDLYSLYKLMEEEDPSVPRSACPMTKDKKDKVLTNRNNNWIKQLPKLLKANPSFIVVGAGHLAGKDGILYQLNKLGYKVEAMK